MSLKKQVLACLGPQVNLSLGLDRNCWPWVPGSVPWILVVWSVVMDIEKYVQESIDLFLGSRYSASWLSWDKPTLLVWVSWSFILSPCLSAFSPLSCSLLALLMRRCRWSSLDSPLISLPLLQSQFYQFSHSRSVLHCSAPSITNTSWRFPSQLHHQCPKETFNKVVLNLLLGSTQTDHFPNPSISLEEVEGGFRLLKCFFFPPLLQNGTLEGEVCRNCVVIHSLR